MLNMTKEYRAELRGISKQIRSLTGLTKRTVKDRDRRLAEIQRAFDRFLRAQERNGARLRKRQAILEGRLS